VRAVVLDSPFSDYRRIAREKLAGFFLTWPLLWFSAVAIEDGYSPAASIKALSPIPVLFIHGEQDLIVPLSHSQRLYESPGQPKQLWVVPDSGHIEAVKNKTWRQRLTEFLQRYSG
jgi:fermentation-respiration switch protein FrsA (DUF1100 family)